MKEKFIELYREWVQEEPLYEVESLEVHAARFAEWVLQRIEKVAA